MSEQEKICVKCGQTCGEGHNYCFNCGAYLGAQEEKALEICELHTWIEQSEAVEQIEQIEQAPAKKTNIKTYKARRTVYLILAIAGIILALSFLIVAIICEKVSILLYYEKSLYEIGSPEYLLSNISDMYYSIAGIGYSLAIMFAIACIVSSIMFFISLKKVINAKRAIALEAQDAEDEQIQIEAVEETAEESSEEPIAEEQIAEEPIAEETQEKVQEAQDQE